jgi:hypothetical protein
MAIDAAKLKSLGSRRTLGTPPRDALPEITGEPAQDTPPAAPPSAAPAPVAATIAPSPPQPVPEPPPPAHPRTIVDGRTLRKTGRTVQLGTRVTEQFAIDLRTDAEADGLMIVEVLEEAVAARRRLRALARPGESLDEVVDRLTGI